MKVKTIFLTALLMGAVASQAFAQVKIGYANIELILAYMPETKSMTQTLETYQTQLGKKLQAKQQYAQGKLQEAQEKAAALQQAGKSPENDPEIQKLSEELQKLDQEIQKEAAEADQKLNTKRMDMMAPITEKLEKVIKEVAAAEGYDFILNSVDGSGVSIVLHGPEDRDLTKNIMAKLGIEVPSEASSN